MTSKCFILVLSIVCMTVGCKEKSSNASTTNLAAGDVDPILDDIDEINPSSIDTLPIIDSLDKDIDTVTVDSLTIDSTQVMVYEAFNENEALKRLNLEVLIKERSLKKLLTAKLREGDRLEKQELETGDGTFDIYVLINQNDVELAYFYYERDIISPIEIIDPLGVPEGMISPGCTYSDLRKIYEDPVAYGSEIEGRVYIHEDEVGYRMKRRHGWYEPVELEDDTEILYIQF